MDDLEGLKDLKVRLPARQLLIIEQLRVLRGRRKNDVIREALDAYFAAQRAAQA